MKTNLSKKTNKIQKNVHLQAISVTGQPVLVANLTIILDKILLELEDSSHPPVEFSFNGQEVDHTLASFLSNLNIKGVRLFGKKKVCEILAANLLRKGVRPFIAQENDKVKKSMDRRLSGIPVINTNVAGIDIGKSLIYVAVPPNMAKDHVRAFATFTEDLKEIVAWLKSLNITTVAMESTSVYWVPLHDFLEQEGIAPILVNPKHVKMLPGRKTDVLDAQWLMRLLACGMLHASFIPPLQIRPLRELARYRQDLMDRAGDCLNRVHKMLSLMNIQLCDVISDISGKTGQAILNAIINGNRNYEEMAKLADKNCKSTKEEIMKALHGTYKEEHMYILEEEFRMYESINDKIIKTEKKIREILERLPNVDVEPLPKSLKRIRKKTDYNRSPYCFDLRTLLYQKFGYDLTVYSGIDSAIAATVIFETGGKLDAFATHKHFSSWLGVCPGNKVSGGKRLSGSAPKKFNRAGQALRMAANANLKADSALGGHLRRLIRRGKSKKAARKATANKLAFLIYNTMKFGHKYVEKGAEEYEKRYEEKSAKGHIKALKEMGYDCSTIKKVACCNK